MKPGNCWEVMECGREPDGVNVGDYGICPAVSNNLYDGINSGKNSGRLCWAVAGTFCGRKITCKTADEHTSCVNCEFFKMVQEEEGNSFIFLVDDIKPNRRKPQPVLVG